MFGSVIDVIGSVIDTIASGIGNVINAIIQIPLTIIDLLKDALSFLFVPDGNYFDSKIQTYREKFVFADSIISVVELFKNAFSGTDDFGSLYIDLGKAETGAISYGVGKINVLNVSWYKRFKSYGDTVLSGLLWGVFIWNLFKHLPNIIRGLGGHISTTNLAEKGE